jgi:hypothetical protein
MVAQAPGDGAPTFSNAASIPEPSEGEIRARAYQMYLERGAADGADFDDWLRAEYELKRRG